MRILWHSNHRNSPTGYGSQTNIFAPMLHKSGHHVDISAFHGAGDVVLRDADGIRTLPGARDPWGNDIIEAHMAWCKSDVVISLVDPYILDGQVWGRLPWCAWAPVDGAPAREDIIDVLRHARWVWAMSRFGEQQLKAAGLEDKVAYVPHGVDSGSFRPIDRGMARKESATLCERDLTDRFVIVMNAANKGTPSRKGFGYGFEAVARLAASQPDALLWVHSDQMGLVYGEDLQQVAQAVGLSPENIVFSQQYTYAMGMFSPKHLNLMYNAADVLLAPSLGEGFGIPLVEAQMAGCPVIATDFSAMSELVLEGWPVRGHPIYVGNGIRMMAPDVDGLHAALDAAKCARAYPEMRAAARNKALAYDAETVFRQYMLPAVNGMAAEVAEEKRQAVAIVADHEHRWAAVGLQNGDGTMSFPCHHKGCYAELRVMQDGADVVSGGFDLDVAGETLDIEDDPAGGVAKLVMRELLQAYRLDQVPVAPGDVIVDVGAQVGVVSVWLGKRYPEARIIAFEPVPENFARLERNLAANGVTNVLALNVGVTRDGRDLTLYGKLSENSGGASAFVRAVGDAKKYAAKTVRLADVLDEMGIARVKLLKVDAEGAEYELLDDDMLKRLEWLAGEFHHSDTLFSLGYEPFGLLKRCVKHLDPDKVHVTACRISN